MIFRSRGFTLIELLVVISIIALLSSVVLSSLNSARHKARVAKVVSESTQIYKAFYAAVVDSGESYLNKSDTSGQNSGGTEQARWYVPDCSAALNVSADDRPNGEYVKQFATAIGAYMKTMPLDPWGRPYWIDAAYVCTSGEYASCPTSGYHYVIGSGGPNMSNPNTYDADNVVIVLCRHP